MLRHRKFPSLAAIDHFLNGGVVGGKNLREQNYRPGGDPAVGIWGLVGKTVIFNTPSDTVTFVAGSIVGFLTVGEILDQIATQAAGVLPSLAEDGTLRFIEAVPSTGIVVDNAGTANADLGLPVAPAADMTGVVYGADPTTAPAYLRTYYSSSDLSHIVVTLDS
jgi:hypothetical protein